MNERRPSTGKSGGEPIPSRGVQRKVPPHHPKWTARPGVGWGGARPPPSHPTHHSWRSRPRSLQQVPAQTGRGRHIPLLRLPPCRGSHPPPGRPAMTPFCSKLSSGPLLPPAAAAPNAAGRTPGRPEHVRTPHTRSHTHSHPETMAGPV